MSSSGSGSRLAAEIYRTHTPRGSRSDARNAVERRMPNRPHAKLPEAYARALAPGRWPRCDSLPKDELAASGEPIEPEACGRPVGLAIYKPDYAAEVEVTRPCSGDRSSREDGNAQSCMQGRRARGRFGIKHPWRIAVAPRFVLLELWPTGAIGRCKPASIESRVPRLCCRARTDGAHHRILCE